MEDENKINSSGKLKPPLQDIRILSVMAAASGILVVSAAVISLVMLLSHVYVIGNPTMMDQWQQMLTQRQRAEFAEAISSVLAMSGIANLVGSYMMYRKPAESEKWGYLVLMGSVTALFWIGGFLIGPLLGILAGSIAVYLGRRSPS